LPSRAHTAQGAATCPRATVLGPFTTILVKTGAQGISRRAQGAGHAENAPQSQGAGPQTRAQGRRTTILGPLDKVSQSIQAPLIQKTKRFAAKRGPLPEIFSGFQSLEMQNSLKGSVLELSEAFTRLHCVYALK
jgi:hypothetical protein